MWVRVKSVALVVGVFLVGYAVPATPAQGQLLIGTVIDV